MKKRHKKGRSAAQKAATKRMLAANKRRSNPRKRTKRAKARASNPKRTHHRHHHAHKPAKRSSHKRRSNPAPARRRSTRRRRRNPDVMRTAMQILKPIGFAAIAAAVGLGGSFMLARAQFQSRRAIIAANLAAGLVAGGLVGLIDKSDGKPGAIVAAMPFLVTGGQNLLAGGSLGGATAAADTRAQNASSQGIAGLYEQKLLGGITVDAFAENHRLAGITSDDIGGIVTDDLQGVAVDSIWG